MAYASQTQAKQTRIAGKTTYLPGAAQLKEGGGFPMGHEDPSHRQQETPSALHDGNYSELITGDCLCGYWVVLVLYSLLKGVTTLPTGVGAERAP